LASASAISLGLSAKPKDILINRKKNMDFVYDEKAKVLRLTLPAGESLVVAK
jgi:hypothetical protein